MKRFPFRALALLVLAGTAHAEGVRPRLAQELHEVERADADRRAGRPQSAVERLGAIFADPDARELFVGEHDRITAPGYFVRVREMVTRWAAGDAEFAAAWVREGEVRLSTLGGQGTRIELEQIAWTWHGLAPADKALRLLAEQAWAAGDAPRAAEQLRRVRGTLTALEAARVASGRRKAGLDASPEEVAARWDDAGAAGFRLGFLPRRFPPLSSKLVVRGQATTLRAFLKTLRPDPANPWGGERNAFSMPFPPLGALDPVAKKVVLFEHPPTDPAQGMPPVGVLFSDLDAYTDGSPVRAIPFGKTLWVAGRSSLAILGERPDGSWSRIAGPKLSAPISAAALSTDGERVFTLVVPKGEEASGRQVPAAFGLDEEWIVPVWSGWGVGEDHAFAGAYAMGPPLLDHGQLYVPAALVGVAFTPGMVCLDALTGRMCWSTTLGETTQGLNDRRVRLAAPPPTLRDGILYFNTNAGLSAALDAATGIPVWVRRDSDQPSGGSGWAEASPVIGGRWEVVTSRYSGRGLVIDRATGDLLRQRATPLADLRFLLAGSGNAVLVGSDGGFPADGGARGIVNVLNLQGGRDVQYELPDAPAGRPVVWEGTLIAPTTRGLLKLDLKTGKVEVIVEWREADAGDIVRMPGGFAVLRNGEVRIWREKK